MYATTEPSHVVLNATRQEAHPRCVVCGRRGPGGLGLEFRLRPDGRVTAEFDCAADFQGYEGVLHGGVISALADGAMTNCLFAHGVAAVTAELNVRFRHPLTVGTPLTVTAWITRRSEPLFLMAAELTQAGQIRIKATGKFVEIPKQPENPWIPREGHVHGR